LSTLLETTSWLVDIPSVTGGEKPLRDAIANRLFDRPHVVVGDSLVVGMEKEAAVLLVGHLDTVPGQGQVAARIEGDRLHGLGSTDMKGGLAVMIHLVERLGSERVAAVFYAGEEGPLTGNQLVPVFEAVPWLKAASAAFVLEPTDRQVQAGCQGGLNARVVFQGLAAHSARPWLGENAITKAGVFLGRVDRMEPDDHLVDGLLFREVVSVTKAAGGVAHNVVPPLFELNVNYRFAPDRSVEEAIAQLKEICSDADRFEVSDIAPAGSVDVSHSLFQELIASSGAPVVGKQGWTDVAQLGVMGIPALNFGPGETTLAHRPGESVRIDDLDWAYESLLTVLR
jgi:succinyl-diaminopimelate desuccinylase